VFISASSNDYAQAEIFYKFLTEQGTSAFLSDQSLHDLGEADYRKTISAVIEHTQHMVVVTSSKENVTARWVQYEWGLFLNILLDKDRKGNLLTLLVPPMKIKDLPIDLKFLQSFQFSKENFKKIMNYLAPGPVTPNQGTPPFKGQPDQIIPSNSPHSIGKNLYEYRQTQNLYISGTNSEQGNLKKFVDPPLMEYVLDQDLPHSIQFRGKEMEIKFPSGMEVISKFVRTPDQYPSNLLLLVGEMGAGKSTLLQRVEMEAWGQTIVKNQEFSLSQSKNDNLSTKNESPDFSWGGRIPIFITCNELVTECEIDSPKNLLSTLSKYLDLITEREIRLEKDSVTDGNYLFLFDSLDEISLRSYKELFSTIQKFAQWQNNRVVLSVREIYFEKIRLKKSDFKSSQIQQLKAWTKTEILKLIRQHLNLKGKFESQKKIEAKAKKLWKTWKNEHNLEQLCSNAFLLETLLDQLEEVQRQLQLTGTISRWQVYKNLISQRLEENLSRKNSFFDSPELIDYRMHTPVFLRHCCWSLAFETMEIGLNRSTFTRIPTYNKSDQQIWNIIRNMKNGEIRHQTELAENGLLLGMQLKGGGDILQF